jgi:hypothetical protein
MTTIARLSPAQLGRHATNVFMYGGRHVEGARLIYHALRRDPAQPEALRCLSDLLDAKGTEQLSAVVVEYALALGALPDDDRKALDDLLFLAKWGWGLSRHRNGDVHLAGEAFEDRSAFVMDEQRYGEFLLEGAFRSAHVLCGCMGGLLAHKRLGSKAPLAAIFSAGDFEDTPEYSKWLESDTSELDGLEAARVRAQCGRKPPNGP